VPYAKLDLTKRSLCFSRSDGHPMKAVMLAAGFGERLELSADAPPKILLRFGGKSLLQRHAEILQFLGFDELVLGLGNKADQIRREIAELDIGSFVRTVDCPDYARGAPYTLWGLRAEFEGPVVFMDGDVLYDHRLMARLCEASHPTCFAMDRKVRAGQVEGRLRPYIDAERTDFIYEQAFGDLMRASPPGTFDVVDVTDLPWTEIDFPHDLEYANTEIFPRLQPLPT
jgi:choline kinase